MDKKVLGIGLVIVGVAAVLAGVFFITKKDSLDLANQSMPTNNQIK